MGVFTFFLSDTCVFVHVACAYLCVNMCTFIWVRAEVVNYSVTAGTWACEADAGGWGGWTCPCSDFAEVAVGALSVEHSV